MKKPGIIIILIAILFSEYACQKTDITAHFKDMHQLSIKDYMLANKDKYSSFLSLLEKGRLLETLGAYNPKASGYTLFLPTNDAVDAFIQQSNKYASLDDMLKDTAYVYEFCRYHVVNMAIRSNDFPFGALSQMTLSGDYLTVSFVVQQDTSYYLINNMAPVAIQNIELSNGFIHVISAVLKPISNTTYSWLASHPEYSIFKDAVDITGMKDSLDIDVKNPSMLGKSVTLLVEADSIYHKRGIYGLSDLENLVSPGKTDYTNVLNPLYNYVGYHMLRGTKFLSTMYGQSTNYQTFSDIPILISGKGMDIQINPGKESFDTLVNQMDTTIINWVGFYYDQSNIITQTGAVHFIDQVLQQQKPSRANQYFEFWEEPLLLTLRQTPGSYLITDHSSLQTVQWSGADLTYVRNTDVAGVTASAWSNDYFLINGDFTMSYSVPAIVQGNYTVYIRADGYNSTNALIEVYIDGKKLGQYIDLTAGGTADSPFNTYEVGTIEFLQYQPHTVEVQSLIPGRFCWDFVQFEPI